MSLASILSTFHHMKYRCYKTDDPNYVRYGARGITVYDKWLKNPVSFIKWAENNGYEKGKHIHRKDNTGGYSPDNCVFLTPDEHADAHRMIKGRVSELIGAVMAEEIDRDFEVTGRPDEE